MSVRPGKRAQARPHTFGELLGHTGAVVDVNRAERAIAALWGDSNATKLLQGRVGWLEEQVRRLDKQREPMRAVALEFYKRELDGKSPVEIPLEMETKLRALEIHQEFGLVRGPTGLLNNVPRDEQPATTTMSPAERATKQRWGREDIFDNPAVGLEWLYENNTLKHGL